MIHLFGNYLKTGALACIVALSLTGCKASGKESAGTVAQPPFMSAVASAPPQTANDALPPEKTGGFDGQRAFALVAKQVSFGPRPAGSPAISKLQDFLLAELQSYGCTVETDNFSAETPAGRLTMKNFLVKIPGEKPGIILLGTHYDTVRIDNFVGADDAGSSTAVMLEIARLLCKQRGKNAVWIAFFDGEEAVKQWSDTDGRYGSRQMAARLAMSHDASKIRAFLLADIVGGRNPVFKRESTSTKWLVDLVWGTARKLGYANAFVEDSAEVQDDHDPFLKREVPSVDVINDFLATGYWHTPQDTLDKISAKTLGIVGHVFLESVKQLQLR
jgi:Zn-dependent M28 family amino/carboxypeptidase